MDTYINQKHVVEPNDQPDTEVYQGDLSKLEPINKWSDDLEGKRVVLIDTSDSRLKIGQKGTYEHKSSCGLYAVIRWDNRQKPTHILLGSLALLPGQEEKTPIAIAISDSKDSKDGFIVEGLLNIGIGPIVKYEPVIVDYINHSVQVDPTIYIHTPEPITEITHSCTLEFPNGDRVEIPPPPESEGWVMDEIIYKSDYSKPRHWPSRTLNAHYYDTEKCGEIEMEGELDYKILHPGGCIILYEYSCRIFHQSPQIINLTSWTREVIPNAEPRQKTMMDEARERFPLLLGEE